MLDPEQRIWGFETNFGGLAQLALVKANQLLEKPTHLTWEEAAVPGLVNSTAYRQLVSRNGAGMKQGDIVLIWGASGGLGSYATQMALNGGATPVCVVSSARRRPRSAARMGAELIIDRNAEGYTVLEGRAHPGPEGVAAARQADPRADRRATTSTSSSSTRAARRSAPAVYVARKGGTIVTCASTSGFMHEYDNRYLWMNLKRIVGSHFANYREAWEANRLIQRGKIHPTLSRTYRWPTPVRRRTTCIATCTRARSACCAWPPRPGSASRDPQMRANHLDEINRFRNT